MLPLPLHPIPEGVMTGLSEFREHVKALGAQISPADMLFIMSGVYGEQGKPLTRDAMARLAFQVDAYAENQAQALQAKAA